jgi:hypothetical protein
VRATVTAWLSSRSRTASSGRATGQQVRPRGAGCAGGVGLPPGRGDGVAGGRDGVRDGRSRARCGPTTRAPSRGVLHEVVDEVAVAHRGPPPRAGRSCGSRPAPPAPDRRPPACVRTPVTGDLPQPLARRAPAKRRPDTRSASCRSAPSSSEAPAGSPDLAALPPSVGERERTHHEGRRTRAPRAGRRQRPAALTLVG